MTVVMSIVVCLFTIAAVLLALPSALLFVQACVALSAKADETGQPQPAVASRPSVVVLIPAHDEEGGIAHTLANVRLQLAPGDRMLVVADNCSDATAAVAVSMGAEVLERHDLTLRGKGYALDHGVRHLASNAPDVVVIVDADCLLQPGCLDALALQSARQQRPVQAVYLMVSPSAPTLKMRVAEFAWRVKNHARPWAMHRMGLPCELTGAGMAFPWRIILDAPLATGHLVEDMQLGLDLGAAGMPPMLCPSAVVTSVFPERSADAAMQRTRWEHGHLSVILASGPRLFWKALVEGRGSLMAQVLDLCVPPLVLLLLLQVALAVVTGVVALVTGAVGALLACLSGLTMLVGAILGFWWRFGADLVKPVELLKMPLYIAAKLPIYLRFVWGRQVEWVRTKRNDRSE